MQLKAWNFSLARNHEITPNDQLVQLITANNLSANKSELTGIVYQVTPNTIRCRSTNFIAELNPQLEVFEADLDAVIFGRVLLSPLVPYFDEHDLLMPAHHQLLSGMALNSHIVNLLSKSGLKQISFSCAEKGSVQADNHPIISASRQRFVPVIEVTFSSRLEYPEKFAVAWLHGVEYYTEHGLGMIKAESMTMKRIY